MRPASEILKTVPLLDDLNESERQQFAAFFNIITLTAGETLYSEGSAANSACCVVDGELDAFAKLPGGGEAMVGAIRPGAIIGEMALLEGGLRTASVRARTNVTALEMSAAFFQAALGQLDLPAHKILRRIIRGLADRLDEVRAQVVNQMELRMQDGVYVPAEAAVAPAGSLRSGEVFDYRRFVSLLPFFRKFTGSEIGRLMLRGKLSTSQRSTEIYSEGSPASAVYLVIRGSVECIARRAADLRLSVVGPGRICGANEVIGDRNRQCSAVARADTLLLEFDGPAFRQLFTDGASECLKFQAAIGLNQLCDLQSANNLLALLANLERIRAGPQLATVS